MNPKIMPVTDLRRDTRAVISSVKENGDVVYITQHGRPSVVLLDYQAYETLLKNQSTPKQGWPPNFFSETFGILADTDLTRPDQTTLSERESFE